MTEYIAHERYQGKDMHGNEILIRRGKRLEKRSNTLYYEDSPVCIYRSLVGKQYFARNDDGHGLERGKLTHAIAYSPRYRRSDDDKSQQRFTDAEIKTLRTDWNQYLKPNLDTLLFNDAFFDLPVDILKQIAASVNIEA